MAAVEKPVFPVQVRALVEFVWRRGDLGGDGTFVGPNRALQGIRGHQQIQRSRPTGYEKEVRLSYELDAGEFTVRVQGRIDGVLTTGQEVLLEEIKTLQGHWDGTAEALHWAQAKVYGFIYAREHALDRITIRLFYLDLDSGKATEFQEGFAFDELAVFFQDTTRVYVEWLRERFAWEQVRNRSIEALEFPFPQYRAGQRKLAVAAYRALSSGGNLFLEAPTGIGKTVSVLFPAVKAMGEGKLERIFYLTARTLGRTVAEKACDDLRQAGLKICTLTLTAKEKICVQAGQPCDSATCPLARGYYDRYRPAMREALARESLTRREVEEVGQHHQVCPFELSLDLSSWVDAVICDYNYVFDPKVYLRRHFAEPGGDYAFLVDEAHNLVDRGREMFSAELRGDEIRAVSRALKSEVPRCARALNRLASMLRGLSKAEAPELDIELVDEIELSLFAQKSGGLTAPVALGDGLFAVGDAPSVEEAAALRASRSALGVRAASGVVVRRGFPEELLPLLEGALKQAESWLAQNRPAAFRQELLELYFALNSFGRTAELYDERYVTICEPESGGRVRLYCLDPSRLLREARARGKAAVFFSATLTPLDYFRDLLGGSPEDRTLQLGSPFPETNLAVLVQDRIKTHFKARGGTLAEVAQAIAAVAEARPGNYLVYFPSYKYLEDVRQQFQAGWPAVRLLAQRPGMTEAEREAFLAAFVSEHNETLLGFAVMGGIFGEGIDLVGERLLGAIIVGVGLPQLCSERDLIRAYFDERIGTGFEYAYTFPGMNRVLQATGRVIRSETDRGVVLLVDARFSESRYRRLFPAWWRPERVRSVGEIARALKGFWEGGA